jgi:hypothetical protein
MGGAHVVLHVLRMQEAALSVGCLSEILDAERAADEYGSLRVESLDLWGFPSNLWALVFHYNNSF